uniref:Uncharacterized protein n=1 Tax=Molossus molossus TaxID=27622 RepID=A0A7J8C8V9_MOLMO|nr:hypothetical protein HJG59_009937 [Molossus molossus]
MMKEPRNKTGGEISQRLATVLPPLTGGGAVTWRGVTTGIWSCSEQWSFCWEQREREGDTPRPRSLLLHLLSTGVSCWSNPSRSQKAFEPGKCGFLKHRGKQGMVGNGQVNRNSQALLASLCRTEANPQLPEFSSRRFRPCSCHFCRCPGEV